MNSLSFGSMTTPAGGLGLGVGMRMRPKGMPRISTGARRGMGMPKGGLSLLKFATGGYAAGGPTSMTAISDHDAMLGMPGRTIPDYLLARMDDGGAVFDHPIVRAARRRIAEGREPRISARMGELGDLDSMERHVDDSGMRRLGAWNPELIHNEELQRGALHDLWNAGPLSRIRDLEARDTMQDMAGSVLDPTQLPMFMGGIGTRIAPRIFRAMGRMPLKAMAGELGAWNLSGPNVRDAGSMEESRFDLPWGYSELPQNIRGIGHYDSGGLVRLPAPQTTAPAPREPVPAGQTPSSYFGHKYWYGDNGRSSTAT